MKLHVAAPFWKDFMYYLVENPLGSGEGKLFASPIEGYSSLQLPNLNRLKDLSKGWSKGRLQKP